jgi:hypothetical protein
VSSVAVAFSAKCSTMSGSENERCARIREFAFASISRGNADFDDCNNTEERLRSLAFPVGIFHGCTST